MMAMRSCVMRCLGRGGGGGDSLMIWQSELKRHAMGEYSVAVTQANTWMEDQSQVIASPSATLVGVYDGHGGPQASRFVNAHLFPFLLKFANEQGGLSVDVINEAFGATEEEFCRLVKQSLPTMPQIASVGSCCLVGAVTDDMLYVANLGDSRAVLGSGANEKKTVVAERLSTDHNVAVEEVRKEVKALHPDDSHIVMEIHGVWRIKGIIQVSRSIGDLYLKKPEFQRDPDFRGFLCPVPLKRAVITAEPSVIIRKLKPQDKFLIFASDGLWEQLTDDEAVEIVFNNPRRGIAKRLVRAALQEAANKRELRYNDLKKIERGTRRHFHDDITVVVIYLDQQNGSSGNRLAHTTSPIDLYSPDEGQVQGDHLHTMTSSTNRSPLMG